MPPPDEVAALQDLIADLGAAMTSAGESVDVVHDRLARVAEGQGLEHVDILIAPTSIFVQVGVDASSRVKLASPRDEPPRLDQVSALYTLVAQLEADEVSVTEGRVRLDALMIARPRYHRVVRIAGHAVLCAGMAFLLQPAWGGVLVALILGAGVGVFTTLSLGSLRTVLPCLASFVVATAVFSAAKVVDADNPIRSLIPPLVTFLPGAAITTGTVELAARQVVSGSSRLVQGVVELGLMAFGIVAAAELVGAPSTQLLDHPFHRLGAWAPWVGLVVVTAGHHFYNCAPRRTVLPILAVLIIAHSGQAIGASIFDAGVSGFFGALAMTPAVLWMSDTSWGPPSMVTFLPGFWLLVPGAAGLIGVTGIIGTDSSLGTADFGSAIKAVFSIALGILIGTAAYTSIRKPPRRLPMSGRDSVGAD